MGDLKLGGTQDSPGSHLLSAEILITGKPPAGPPVKWPDLVMENNSICNLLERKRPLSFNFCALARTSRDHLMPRAPRPMKSLQTQGNSEHLHEFGSHLEAATADAHV